MQLQNIIVTSELQLQNFPHLHVKFCKEGGVRSICFTRFMRGTSLEMFLWFISSLIQDSVVWEKVAALKCAVLDKTGTITKGKPEAATIFVFFWPSDGQSTG